MSTQVTIGIIALVSVSACGLISTLANFLIMEKVNEKLPKNEQIGALGWYFSKTLRLHREYRRLYPGLLPQNGISSNLLLPGTRPGNLLKMRLDSEFRRFGSLSIPPCARLILRFEC
jgi:hypothetical protein